MAANKRLPACTDLGNAELFAALYGYRLRFDHSQGRWLLYAGHWWVRDVDGALMRLAKDAARYRLQESANIADETEREHQAKWARKSEARQRLEAMLHIAKSLRPIADDGRKWDCDPWLTGVANGVIDLRTGKLRDGRPEDCVTLHSEIAFDPKSTCPRWERFFSEIFDGDDELISYMHRAVGYSLSGQTSEQCFFCCYGEGANGKSTLLKTVRYVVGDYASNLPFSAFELDGRSSISNDVAIIPGRRFVTAIETDEAAALNTARIKALTGEDPMTVRKLYQEYFTFLPVSKFWLAFNHKPSVSDDSHGFWRRVHMIPFNCQFDPHAEPKLPDTLRAEAAGILAWAVRGCLAWQAEGLNPPAVANACAQRYKEESDPLRDFIADRCVLDSNAQISVAALYDEYVKWCLDTMEQRILDKAAFGRRVEALGCRKERKGHDRQWTWFGITIATNTNA